MEVALMRQFSAMAASTANSTALRFRTGNAPGNPRHTGQTLVLGGSPKWVEQEQKILVAVRSWTCTSNPITGSYFDAAATDTSGVATIIAHYKCRTHVGRALLSTALRLILYLVVSLDHEELGGFQQVRSKAADRVSAPHRAVSESRSDTSPTVFRNTSARCPWHHERR